MTTTRAKFVFEYLGVAIFLAVTDYNDDEIDVSELIKRYGDIHHLFSRLCTYVRGCENPA